MTTRALLSMTVSTFVRLGGAGLLATGAFACQPSGQDEDSTAGGDGSGTVVSDDDDDADGDTSAGDDPGAPDGGGAGDDAGTTSTPDDDDNDDTTGATTGAVGDDGDDDDDDDAGTTGDDDDDDDATTDSGGETGSSGGDPGVACGDGSVVAGELCYAEPSELAAGGAYAVDIIDFDGDGHLDVLLGGSSALVLAVGDGTGDFVVTPAIADADDVRYMDVGDVDGDGVPDVVFPGNFDSVRVGFGAGDGTLSSVTDYDVFSDSAGILLDDFDADGDLDLAVADNNDDNMAVRLNNGAGVFGAQVTYAVPNASFITRLGAADVDEDGNLDLFASRQFDPEVFVLPGFGNGFFDPAEMFTVDFTWRATGARFVDLSGDGELDAVTPQYFPSTVAVRHGTGDGGFGPLVFEFPTGGDNPIGMEVEDFDGDGILDVAILNSANFDFVHNLVIMRGDGTGLFLDAIEVAPAPNADNWDLDSGDLNEDGVLDFVSTSTGVFGAVTVVLSEP